MNKIIVIAAVFALVVAGGFRLKSSHDAIHAKKTSTGVVSGSVSVTVSTVDTMAANRSVELVGTLTAWKELTITSETQGKIVSLNLEAGQTKIKGSLIAMVDDKLKQLAVQTAKTTVAKLEKDFVRIDNLNKGGVASGQQLDDAQNSLENAKIQLKQAEKQLADATILSPINGIITQKSVELGTYVTIGSAVATIVDISKLTVKMNVSEAVVYLLKTGDKAVITTDIYPGASFEGQILFISAKGDDAHTYPVEIGIENKGKYPLKAGSFVTVKIAVAGEKTMLSIPRQAMQGSSREASVYVIDNGKAHMQSIVVGGEYDGYLEVVSGLTQGDTVVVSGQVNLSDDKPVLIIKN